MVRRTLYVYTHSYTKPTSQPQPPPLSIQAIGEWRGHFCAMGAWLSAAMGAPLPPETPVALKEKNAEFAAASTGLTTQVQGAPQRPTRAPGAAGLLAGRQPAPHPTATRVSRRFPGVVRPRRVGCAFLTWSHGHSVGLGPWWAVAQRCDACVHAWRARCLSSAPDLHGVDANALLRPGLARAIPARAMELERAPSGIRRLASCGVRAYSQTHPVSRSRRRRSCGRRCRRPARSATTWPRR